MRSDGLRSPSVQLQISPAGEVEVLSTHDQILGGPENQVYLGCRFPARPEYRLAIQAEACKVAEVLAERGASSAPSGSTSWSIPTGAGDRITLSEINLRMGGTTHPYWMARLATGGPTTRSPGELRLPAGGRRCYLATDNLKSRAAGGSLAGGDHRAHRPGRAGLRPVDRDRRHPPPPGRPPAGEDGGDVHRRPPEEADVLYHDVLAVLADVEGTGCPSPARRVRSASDRRWFSGGQRTLTVVVGPEVVAGAMVVDTVGTTASARGLPSSSHGGWAPYPST